jgi:hypothetical protein
MEANRPDKNDSRKKTDGLFFIQRRTTSATQRNNKTLGTCILYNKKAAHGKEK